VTVRNLDSLLDPASLAIVGASNRSGSVGATVWRNARAAGFKGPVYAVNPKHAQLDGEPVYATVGDLPAAPELAILCTPAPTVPGLIAELGARGTRAAIVTTAGLDAATRQAMLDAARPHLLRVLGPNCLGLLTPALGLNASFAHIDALPGDLAFVSQSGALVTAVLDWARERGIGFSHLVSLGERADVDFGDMLDWLASDRRTRAILLYIESIESPRKFMSAARAAARNKPVIVVKAGRAGNGLKAAASHTGALAGSDRVFDAAIRRAGMLRVDTLDDLFVAAQTLARLPRCIDDALVMMTNGGGAGVMAADAAAIKGVPLTPLDDALRGKLDAVLPATWSRANPIDIIGDAPAERYVATLRTLLEHDAAATVLFMHAPTAIVPSDDIARACVPLLREHAGRVMACWLGGPAVAAARRRFEQAGVPTYETPEQAVHAFAMLATYRRNQRQLLEVPPQTPPAVPDREAARRTVDLARADGRAWLAEAEVMTLLKAYGIPVVPSATVAPDPAEAVRAARDIGYPVALKIVSQDIVHKSDVGGVALGIADEAALMQAARGMLQQVRTRLPDARIQGLAVQAMVRRPQAREVIVGASVDPIFGPVLLFGHGGTAVEVVGDSAIALPPLNQPLARELVSRTRVAALLGGWRDHAPARLEAVCDVLVAVSQMLADLPWVAELDINPLLADADGVLALDARVRLGSQPCSGAERFSIRPYPDPLEERVLWQGREVMVRPIRPDDEARHREFFQHVGAEDMRLRYFQHRGPLPDSELARLTQIDYEREMAFVAVAPGADGRDETLGVVRAIADPDNIEAEFAILLRSDLHRRGLGRLLLDKMIRYCTERGTRRLTGLALRENRPMAALARSLGFVVDVRGGELRLVKTLCEP
jgi:acetyltransferase